MRNFTFLFFCFLAIPYSSLAQAQNDTIKDIFDMSLEELMQINVESVSKKAENALEAPQTIIVITADEIRRRGYTDLEQLFHDLPGFDISRGNGTQYSQIYQRGYRSKNTERTAFMIDGIEENDLWSNSVWLSRQYPLSNIKHIEVIYGPASTMYGANAFLGVINIVTKDASDIIKNDNTVGVSAQSGYGTWNTRYADVSIAGRYKNMSLSVTGRIYQSDEMDLSNYDDWDYDINQYDTDYYINKLNISDNTSLSQDFKEEIAQAAINLDRAVYYSDKNLDGIPPHYSNTTNDYLLNVKLKIDDFTFGLQTYKRDEGFGAWYRDDYELGPENGGRWVPNNSFLYGKYEKNINDKLSIISHSMFKFHELEGSCEEYYYKGYLNGEYGILDLTNADTTSLLPESERTVPVWTDEYYHTFSMQMRSEMRIIYSPSKKMTIISGTEFRISDKQGDYIHSVEENPEENAPAVEIEGGNHFTSRDFGFFTQANYYILDNLNFVVGGRIDNNKIRVTGGYGTVFTPKSALVYTPGNFILKALYSTAFMDASNWTKFGTTPARLLNNPTLEPETVENYELSAAWKVTNDLFIDIAAYSSNYEGVVGTKDVSFTDEDGNIITTTQHQPVGSLSIQGMQSSLHYKYKNYSAYLNYTYTHPYNTTDDEDVRVGDIADHQINIGINARFFRKLNINLRTNWVGEKPTGENTTISSNPYDKIDAYYIINGAVSYQIYNGIQLQISGNNLLNLEYFAPGVRSANGDYYAARLPQNERNFTGRIIFEF